LTTILRTPWRFEVQTPPVFGADGDVDCLEAGDVRAAYPLEIIRKLFDVERISTEVGDSPEERLARRQLYSRPLVHQLGEWMEQMYKGEPPKSTLAKAIAYSVNRWQALLPGASLWAEWRGGQLQAKRGVTAQGDEGSPIGLFG
jgi:hypothetical protein